ncbi:hypothetical protein J1N35_033851 [Gossypium stocksii]|uniref:Uncharacterized protein n=1 Tax=Gossypium stocksii TaxID=47602 RepID=A0A9D3UQW1_9ROSI|nr:hypothetical protein J1N35_033851 [Gossypium stocksii]
MDYVELQESCLSHRKFDFVIEAKTTNVGKIIIKEIRDCSIRHSSSAYFPSTITNLCMKARVRPTVKMVGVVGDDIFQQQSEQVDEAENDYIPAESEPTEPVEILDVAKPTNTIPEPKKETPTL